MDVQIPLSASISALRNSVRIFTKFCPLLGWSARRVLFLWEIGTGFRILEMCRFIF